MGLLIRAVIKVMTTSAIPGSKQKSDKVINLLAVPPFSKIDFIPYYTDNAITYTCWGLNETMLVKGATGVEASLGIGSSAIPDLS